MKNLIYDVRINNTVITTPSWAEVQQIKRENPTATHIGRLVEIEHPKPRLQKIIKW